MNHYRLSRLAQADLSAIWTYSAEQWGVGQADIYIRGLQRTIAAVAANPRLGRACDDIRAGYFKQPAGSHILFYRLAGAGIEVARILHRRMDFERNL